ncbi:hypothetical protein [Acidihalobacter ferrooxydans]|uniref:Peroxiredoxin n=1 Tax=Acidihalobacter ferrooxydans TaxID=1765967 RepID=A0A1P8UIC8_9GAMM|nr:hypothetical protein [Acidihalobacter ferrooxydans]APZ43577.1 hypothetical protein BW247_11155 [Acidihalobacter ferrooxydans]
MEKWVLQVMTGENWEHVLMMVKQNLERVDLKVVALGKAVVPLFAPGKVRQAMEEAVANGLNLEICTVSMEGAGLSGAELPKGATAQPGLVAISEARQQGYTYFVVA